MVTKAPVNAGKPSRAALVTGASYGVGAATALALGTAGYDVAVTARRVESLNATMEALRQSGVRGIAVPLNLNEPASIEAALTAAVRAFGVVDVLVNNAAAPIRKAAIDVTRAEWDEVMDANLTGTFFLSTTFARSLFQAGRPGCIVNVASTHGFVGAVERSVYGISKGGVIQMTRMLAIEWAPKGLRVNAVAPGRLDTVSPSRAATASDPEYMKTMISRIPLRRLATAEEVASAIVFLASPAAASITGQVLAIDGGITAA